MNSNITLSANIWPEVKALAEDASNPACQAAAQVLLETHVNWPVGHTRFWMALDSLIFELANQGLKAELVEELLKWSIVLREPILGADSLMLAPVWRQLMAYYFYQLDLDNALISAEKLVSIYTGALDPQHPYLIEQLYLLAVVYHKKGMLRPAETLYRRVLKNMLDGSGRSYTVTAREVVQRYAQLLTKNGREVHGQLLSSLLRSGPIDAFQFQRVLESFDKDS